MYAHTSIMKNPIPPTVTFMLVGSLYCWAAGFSGPLGAWIKNPRQLIGPAGPGDVGPSGCSGCSRRRLRPAVAGAWDGEQQRWSWQLRRWIWKMGGLETRCWEKLGRFEVVQIRDSIHSTAGSFWPSSSVASLSTDGYTLSFDHEPQVFNVVQRSTIRNYH